MTEIGISAAINQACAAVIVDENVAMKDFVKLCISANYERTRLLAEGGAQPNLNLSKVRSIPVSLPSRDEQKEIVRRVESLFAMADTVEKQYHDAKKRIDRLTQSILAKAFRGELVPRDPNDEPASELLKRIQSEREAQKPNKTNKRKKTSPKKPASSPKTDDLFKETNQLPTEVSARTTKLETKVKDAVRSKYKEEIKKASIELIGTSFSIDQFRSVSGFSGEYDTLRSLIMNLLKGIPGLSEPLLEVSSWDQRAGDYKLVLKGEK